MVPLKFLVIRNKTRDYTSPYCSKIAARYECLHLIYATNLRLSDRNDTVYDDIILDGHKETTKLEYRFLCLIL